MERIDKIIASQGLYSRSDVKYLVKHKRVAVDGETVTSSSRKADPEASVITIDGKPLIFKKQVYLMLHKPRGFVTTTSDEMGRKCVTDLVQDAPFSRLCHRHIRAESFSLPADWIRTPRG